MWSLAAKQVQTSLGTLPGPYETGQQFSGLVKEHFASRDKEVAFYERQEVRNQAKLAKDPNADVSEFDLIPEKRRFLIKLRPAYSLLGLALGISDGHCDFCWHCAWFKSRFIQGL